MRKLSDEDVRYIRLNYRPGCKGVSRFALCIQFKISYGGQFYNLIHGKTYKHVDPPRALYLLD